MNRAARIKIKENLPAPVGTRLDCKFTVARLHAFAEREKNSSEHRFEALGLTTASDRISAAADELCRRFRLEVELLKARDRPPRVHPAVRFKYSHGNDPDGSHPHYARLMKQGRRVTIVSVLEEGLMIGYGIAERDETRTEIVIVDVDHYSRRASGLAQEVVLAGLKFSIGLGHLIVRALLLHCAGPFHTDATTASSRFIFKSFGFTAAEPGDNPCLLSLGAIPVALRSPSRPLVRVTMTNAAR